MYTVNCIIDAVLGSLVWVLGIDISCVVGGYGRCWVALGAGVVGVLGMAAHHQRELWQFDWQRNVHVYLCVR